MLGWFTAWKPEFAACRTDGHGTCGLRMGTCRSRARSVVCFVRIPAWISSSATFVRSFLGLFVRMITSFSSRVFVLVVGRLVRQVRSLTLVCPPLFAVLLWIPVHPLTCWLIVARAAAISFDPSACSRVVLACGVTTTVCRSLLPHHLGLFRGWWFGFGADGMVIGPGLQKICSGWEEGREGIHPPTE